MKKTLLSIAIMALFANANAQIVYDFGATPQSSVAPAYPGGSSAIAPQWPLDNTTPYVPLPTGATGGIVSRGTGAVQLVTTPITGLSGAYLNFTASTVTTDVPTKFGIYNITPTSNLATIKFNVHFPATTVAGSYLFCFGNGGATGNTASAGSGVSTGQNLAVLRFAATASAITISHYSSSPAGYNATNDFIGSANTLSRDVTHTIALFMNNGLTSQDYVAGGTNTLASGTYDMYVDGVKVLAGATTAGLASGTGASSSLDDMNIMNSVANTAGGTSSMYFDNYVYSNALTPSVLPVSFSQLSAKTAGSNVQVNWTTASEANNDYFEIEGSTDGKTFKNLKTVKSKNGNSSQIQEYQESVTLTDIAGVLALPLLLGFIGFSPASRRRKAVMLLGGVILVATSIVACQKEGNDLLSQKDQNSNSIINGQKTIYIRIKQVDKNGEFSYSNVVAAK